jgi:hypothetical protein
VAEPNNEILDFIFNFNKPLEETKPQEPPVVAKKTAKHAVKASHKFGEFESQYKRYKITTTLKPLGQDQ